MNRLSSALDRHAPASRLHRRLGWLAAGAAALAGTALVNRAAAQRAEAKNPPIGKFIEIDGVRLHYLLRGTGSDIVLIHGNGSLIQDFLSAGLIDRLVDAGHRVLTFDRPGYGYSERPPGIDWTPERQAMLFAEAAARLGLDRPVVFGHSWGTLPALAWALDRPGEVAALVLGSGYFYRTPRPDVYSQKIAALPGVGALLSITVVPLQGRLTAPLGNKLIFSPAEVAQSYLDGMPFELILRPGQLRASMEDGALMPGGAARLSKRYGKLALPVTVIWGDGDKLVGQSGQSARLTDEIGARAVVLPGAGHMIHHIDPDAVAAAILAARAGTPEVSTLYAAAGEREPAFA